MLQVLERELAPLQIEPQAGQPPFAGGALGFLGYDWGRVLERRPAARYDDLAMPGAMFGLYDWALAWDHEAGACWLVSTGLPATGDERARVAAERIEQVRTALARARPASPTPTVCPRAARRPGATSRRPIPCSRSRTRKRSVSAPPLPGAAT